MTDEAEGTVAREDPVTLREHRQRLYEAIQKLREEDTTWLTYRDDGGVMLRLKLMNPDVYDETVFNASVSLTYNAFVNTKAGVVFAEVIEKDGMHACTGHGRFKIQPEAVLAVVVEIRPR